MSTNVFESWLYINRLRLTFVVLLLYSRSMAILNGYAIWLSILPKRVKKLTRDPEAFPIPQALENLALVALSQFRESLDALTQSNISGQRSLLPPTIK